MRSNQPSLAREVDAAVEGIQNWRYVCWLGEFFAAHAGFWFVLIVLYPRYAIVQGLVFRHWWFRRFCGLFYVNFLLTASPRLRRRLFAPFHDALVPPGALGSFDEKSYYKDIQLISKEHPHDPPQYAYKLLEPLRGQHVIEAASGLGKTMLVRHLALQSRQHRPAVLLRALDCGEGVLNAIQKRLQGHARDEAYLRDLVYIGALDIFIDGFNEAPPDTRARIAQFFQESFGGHFVLTTQPLAWDPPMNAQIWELKPLAIEAVEAFMLTQWHRLQPVAKFGQEGYAQVVRQLLAILLEQAGRQEDAGTEEQLRMLCNPMECALAAELLAAGRMPEPGRVLAQTYQLMAKEFRDIEAVPFPNERFAEHVYAWRQSGKPYIDMKGLESEAGHLARHKLMRELPKKHDEDASRWVFRHDKVIDFFLLPAFDGDEHKDRRYAMFTDNRFFGVYDLLADSLSFADAEALWQFLLERAAETGDNILFNRYRVPFDARRRRMGMKLNTTYSFAPQP